MTPPSAPGDDRFVAETRAWLRRAVIGLNLCPFAKAPDAKDRVRYVVCTASDAARVLDALADECRYLARVPDDMTETTLLIAPFALADFLEFNDFLEPAEQLLADQGHEGFVQLVAFHPRFRFAGTEPDDLGNATNCSPYPTLQLLRESSVERAVDAFPAIDTIFEANIATMEALGADGWSRLVAACRADAEGSGPA